jgi:hypothetical protein
MRALLGGDDLAAVVIAAVRAHVVGHLDLAALGADAAGGRLQDAIGAAATMGLGTTLLILWYSHGYLS